MVSITLSVPSELKREMDEFHDVNWSAVAREAIQRKVLLLKKFREFAKESELTEDDALRLGSEVSRQISKKHKR